MNPMKLQYLREEVQYLLDNDFIEPSQSDWSSPCILDPKSDGTFRICTDYKKVNSVTKTDSFPVPRIDDCIGNIGQAKYSRLSLSRNRRDPQKQFEISVLRHIRFVVLRKKTI